jgi:hypothetical protein
VADDSIPPELTAFLNETSKLVKAENASKQGNRVNLGGDKPVER